MGEKIVVGPINKGLRKDREPFVIDNDSFPVLLNAYQWRGRVKRKRGTSLLGRLQRAMPTASIGNSGASPWSILNIYSTYVPAITRGNAQLKQGTVIITIGSGPGIVFTDQGDGTMTSATPGNSGTIDYALGDIVLTHTAGAGVASTASFTYYPDLPVMGIEDFIVASTAYPLTVLFDTVYAYMISNASPYGVYDVSYYKNPATATYTNYVAKSSWTRLVWTGQDYQQFWTINYQGALWATNGVTSPFSATNIGMQYKAIVATTVTGGGPPATVNLQITGHGLVVGDFVFVNEVSTTTGINLQTGYVTTVTDVNNVIVTFPNATIATNGTGGIAQYLTSTADSAKSGIRWFDGDPTNGSATAPVTNTTKGWVNFAPPLSNSSSFSIGDAPAGQYYLVGCKILFAFKDRLVFFGPVIQTSSASSQIYLEDTIIWSQNGTPYYTASFTNSAISGTTTFNPILVPSNQTATAPAYFEDVAGYGGYLDTGIDQPINSVSANEDILIMGFDTLQTRVVYTGNDLVPFNVFVINSEYGTSNQFSVINMDQGVLSRGSRGYVITSQNNAERFDLSIPDQFYDINLSDNGVNRFCSARDFDNEWCYFTYPSNDLGIGSTKYKFPTQTLLFNYRENTWGIFRESYTTYGTFRKATSFTWGTVGQTYPTWGSWNVPWNANQSTLLNPQVLAGNQQGFLMIREGGTANEGSSLYIQAIASSTITSPGHSLNIGDYIIIYGALGMTGMNGLIWKVTPVTVDTFTISSDSTPENPLPTGSYIGGGVIKRAYIPLIQTRQFPVSWEMARKTRLGPQMYLLTKTYNSKINLWIYLSQNSSEAWNDTTIIPDVDSDNTGLIYSAILYTCPESTNLGLTAPNTNLQQLTTISSDGTSANKQSQIWHRVNTGLIGDTVQVGFTMGKEVANEVDDNSMPVNLFSEIEIHGFILDCSPSQMLC